MAGQGLLLECLTQPRRGEGRASAGGNTSLTPHPTSGGPIHSLSPQAGAGRRSRSQAAIPGAEGASRPEPRPAASGLTLGLHMVPKAAGHRPGPGHPGSKVTTLNHFLSSFGAALTKRHR